MPPAGEGWGNRPDTRGPFGENHVRFAVRRAPAQLELEMRRVLPQVMGQASQFKRPLNRFRQAEASGPSADPEADTG